MGTIYYLACPYHKQAIYLSKSYGCTGREIKEGYEVDWRGLVEATSPYIQKKIHEFLPEHHNCHLIIIPEQSEPWEDGEKGWEVLMWDNEDKFTLTTDENREAYYNTD